MDWVDKKCDRCGQRHRDEKNDAGGNGHRTPDKQTNESCAYIISGKGNFGEENEK